MKLRLTCIEEEITHYKSKTGADKSPLALTLQDDSDSPMKELVEFRLMDDEDKVKWQGKCKGKEVEIILRRINKLGGIAIFEGTLLSANPPAVKK